MKDSVEGSSDVRPIGAHPGRDEQTLSSGLVHFGYELHACVAGAAGIPQVLKQPDLTNALLESHLLHARALIEFLILTKNRPFPDDMLRTDFAREWNPAPDDAVTRLKERQKDIHKHLAHLTWARVADTAPLSWTPLEMAQDVLAVARAWARHVSYIDRTVGAVAQIQVEQASKLIESMTTQTVAGGELLWTTSGTYPG